MCLGNKITDGLIVVKRGEQRKLKYLKVLEASHPIPDESSILGAKKILDLVKRAGENDLVLAAITGGASFTCHNTTRRNFTF